VKRSALIRLASSRGSSLLEIVVAGAIFSFLVLALSPSMLNTRKAASLSGNASVATTLALDKLEQLRSLDSDNPQLSPGVQLDPLNPLRAEGTNGGIFTRRWTVVDDTPDFGMKQVTVQVSWRDRTGQSAVNLVNLVMP
jgi:type II secretory pathway pseudopilin PulG